MAVNLIKVKVLRSFCLGKGIDTKIGETIELPEREAKIKIRQGKVQDFSTKEKSKAAREAAKKAAQEGALYPLDEALELIEAAQTIEEIDEVIKGDTREDVLNAAEARKEELGGDK